MANETAATYVPLGREGTGYATILQNTVLPSLQNEQRRADRLYQMEELAKQAAAKAAQKKAEEDAKFAVPYVKVGPAGYYQPEVERLRGQLLKETQQKFARGNYTQGDKINEINNVQGTLDAVVNEGAFQSQRLKDLLPDLQKAGFSGANERSLAQYMTSQYNKPEFFNTDHPTGYVQFLKSRPNDNVSPRVIGETLSKQFQPTKMSVQGKNRTTETFEFSPMFEAEKVYDPLLKANVIKAERPNIPAIQEALKGNKAMLEAADSWVDTRTAEYIAQNPTVPKDQAYDQALNDFWTEATKGLSKSTYDYNVPAPTGSGSGKKQTGPVKKSGPVNLSFTYIPLYSDTYLPKKEKGGVFTRQEYSDWTEEQKKALTQEGQLDLGVGTTIYHPKPQTAGSNKRVILLSNNADAVAQKLVEPSKKGGYTLKTSFQYQASTPVSVRVFKKDTGFPLGSANPKYTYETLTPITDDTYEKMTPAQRDEYTTVVKGELISPMGGVPEETEEGVPKYGTSKVASTQVVVLDESAEDIRAADKEPTGTKKKGFKFKHN
jgi:hypothetical protein